MKTACILITLLFSLTTMVHAEQAFPREAPSHPTLVLSTANAPPNATRDHTGLADRVVLEAFARIGYEVKILQLPSERALINANEGMDDGNYARIDGIEKTYPNLVKVPESITEFRFVAFSKHLSPSFQTSGWDVLKPYNVGIITGWKILEANITGTKSLIRVRDQKILFELLNSGRADLIVYDQRQGSIALKESKLMDIKVLEPPLAVRDMYLYLHRKHTGLVPGIAEAIRSMKQDGTYRRIVDESISPTFRDVL